MSVSTRVWVGMMLVSGLSMLGGVEDARGVSPSGPLGKGDLGVLPSTATGVARGDEPRVKATDESRLIRGGFNVTPRLTVDERYDNNILMSEKIIRRDDFVTDIEPRFLMTYGGRDVDAAADLGVMWTQYAKNSKLSYFSTRGGAEIKADKWTDRMIRGLGLTVSDSYYYTKDFPVFVPTFTSSSLLSSEG